MLRGTGLGMHVAEGRAMRCRTSLSLFVSAFVALAGCYGAPPPEVPETAGPPVVERAPGERIVVDVRREAGTTTREDKAYTCPQGHVPGSPRCLVTTRQREVPIVRTTASARYGGRELTLAELDALTRPSLREAWRAEKVHFEERRATCQSAQIPRWAGIVLTVGGLVVAGVGAARKTSELTVVGAAGVGGGIFAYALGYVAFGGSACSEADARRAALAMPDGKQAEGEAAVRSMQGTADSFNANAR